MKQILIFFVTTLLLTGCGKKENNFTTDELISNKNTAGLQDKKTVLQAELSKIDAALATLEIKKTTEALVAVKTLKDTLFNHYLEIQGNVDTKENILIQPEMPGTLVSLNVKAGQRVSKGQILGRTDDGGMSQQLAAAENQYNLAKTTFERQKRLWDQKIGSEIQFLQAQTQMVAAQKAVLQLKSVLNKTNIKAPFSGIIDEVFVERGEVVAPSMQGLMRIVNLGDMYVSTSVPETYIGKIKVGTTVDAVITSIGKTYKGKIRQIGNNINTTNRSFGIEVAVPNPENLLRPNQVAKLKIVDYSNKKVIVVPTNVVLEDGEKNKYVYIVTNTKDKTGTAKKVIVKIGQSSDNVTEILNGLSANDIIVTEGVNAISEGMKLNF